MKVIAFFCSKFSTTPCANLPSAHPIIYTFHTICKKENLSYCILIIKEKIPYPLPTFIFPWASKNFSVGTQKKIHGQLIKITPGKKLHQNKTKNNPSREKKLPSPSNKVHINLTSKDFIKKEQISHCLYGFI